MTDPKRDAAVAALVRVLHTLPVPSDTDYAHGIPDCETYAPDLLDAMLADPQPYLALLLRVDAVAAALRGAVTRTQTGDRTLLDTATVIIAALTETAAEPARSKEPNGG